VRRAAAFEGGVGLVGDALAEHAHQARLADARLAAEEHRAPAAAAHHLPAIEEQGDLLLAADERRPAARGDRGWSGALPAHAMGGDRLREPLQLLYAERRAAKPAFGDPERGATDHHRPGFGHALEPRRDVDRLAHGEPLAPLAAAHLADHHRAGVDA